MNIGSRIELVRIELGFKKTQIWKAAGLTSGAYSQWMNGGDLSGENLIKVADVLGVSPQWLVDGKGEKYVQNVATTTNVFELPPNSYIANASKLSHVPVYGKGMGGLPDRMFTDEDRLTNGHDEYGEVYSSDKNAFITKVEGNSMFPRYRNKGYALVEPNTEPEIEDDVLVKTKSGEVMLKRLISRRGGIVLASYNDSEVYSFSEDEIVWMYYVAYEVPARKIKSRL